MSTDRYVHRPLSLPLFPAAQPNAFVRRDGELFMPEIPRVLCKSWALFAGVMCCLGWAERSHGQDTFTVRYQAERQVIDGFGASDAWSIDPVVTRWVNRGQEDAVERLADLLFSPERGIGLSAWRFNIGAGSAEQGAGSGIPDPLRRAELLLSAVDAEVDVRKQRGQIRLLREAFDRGVEDFVAFCNSPPVWATKNGLAHPGDGTGVGSTNLKEDQRAEFATFLARVLAYLRGPSVGVPVNYVSPINEPTWDWEGQTQEGTRYNNADIKALYREVHRALARAGLAEAVHIDGPEVVEYTAALSDAFKLRFDEELYQGGMNSRGQGSYRNYIEEFLGDAEMREILGNRISMHGYFSDAWEDRLGELRDLTRQNVRRVSPDAKIWMSEFCILGGAGNAREFAGQGYEAGDLQLALHVAGVMHRDLVRLEVSAWHWWLALTPYDYKDGLLQIGPSLAAETLEPTKLFWSFGNFSRFIRPGFIRLETTEMDDWGGVLGSAYKSPDGRQIVAVFVNRSGVDRSIHLEWEHLPSDLRLAEASVFVTNSEKSLSPESATQTIVVPKHSVLTWVGDFE